MMLKTVPCSDGHVKDSNQYDSLQQIQGIVTDLRFRLLPLTGIMIAGLVKVL